MKLSQFYRFAVCSVGIGVFIGALAGQIRIEPTSSIRGVVLAQHGTPISGARIQYYRQPAPDIATPDPFGRGPARTVDVTGTAVSGDDGIFEISGLPKGRYVLCSEFPVQNRYLHGCTWGYGPTVIDLPTDLAMGIEIVATPAALVDVRVHDPLGLVKSTEFGSNLKVGVFSDSNGWYYAARTREKLGNEWTFSVKVPLHERLRLEVSSGSLLFNPEQELKSLMFTAENSEIGPAYSFVVLDRVGAGE